MLKLIPLYDTTAIINNWKFLTEGVEKVVLHGDDDVSVETIMNRLLSGQLLMWLGFYDNVYCGFMTTKFDEVPLGKKFLWIVHLYKTPKAPKDVFTEGMTQIEEFAKKFQCNAIKFYTLRDKPFARKLASSGWRMSYTEFVKDLKEEDKR